MAKKPHWTQTPEGKKKMSEAQLKSNAQRRAFAAEGRPTMTVGSVASGPSAKPPRIPWNKGKHVITHRKHTLAQRKAISEGLRRRQERLAAAASNGHENGAAPLKTYGKALVKADMRRYAIMGMKQELADLERRREMLIMAIGKE